MAVLNSSQRNKLEKVVIKARELSLQGAINTLEAFAVHHHEPYSHMEIEDRSLRNKLREKATLLGDDTKTDKGHTIDKLAYELAYEYWHRMLFARFLEANNLLIHPTHKIPVTLEECDELGKEEGFDDKWQAAAYYASKMLPDIFRQDDPLMQLRYAAEDRLALEQLIEGISEDVFTADDSLGWVYQYWQTAEKKRINDEDNKIDGDSIAAVTQLFTEPYMVHFLIDNTLGAWWTARNPGITPPVEFKYLRLTPPPQGEVGRGSGSPAAGSFDGWPTKLKDITMLDPCMGSGHFVVDVFSVMAPLRMHDEGLTKAEACDAVITDNIHGLELDDRCTQIAAFNLALTAWKFCGEYRVLPEMNLACCGIAPTGKKEDWVKLANSEPDPTKKERLKGGLARMYGLFQQAPELGSLIDPTTIEKDAFTSDFDELQPFLEQALLSEQGNNKNDERGIIAAGIAKAGKLLAKRYVWQITNVPYLSVSKHSKILLDFGSTYYSFSRHDLATIFLEKMLKAVTGSGTVSVVIPQNWQFLPRYKIFRKTLLSLNNWNIIARLGPKAFQTLMWDFNVILFSLSKDKFSESIISTIDTSMYNTIEDIETALVQNSLTNVVQKQQIDNPDHRIVFEERAKHPLMNTFYDSRYGLRSGDTKRFILKFWENTPSPRWKFHQSSHGLTMEYDGRDHILDWADNKGNLAEYAELGIASLQGSDAWKKKGVCVSLMGELPSSLYTGEYFDNNCAIIWPFEHKDINSLWAFCSSNAFNIEVRKLDQKLNVTNATLLKVPFDIQYWQKVAKEKYPNGLPKPYSDDPTQWLFHGHPLYTQSPLQVSIARLLGYEWPAENDKEMELLDEAKVKISAIKELNLPFDEDGIVCIPPVNGEASASERLRENIIKIWGEQYNGNTLSDLITQEGSKKRDLETYLREDFFAQHSKLFKNRPFIWHIWDGRKDGFAALVNYHKLDKATLEKLIYTYLGDWINQCDLKRQNNVSGADGLLSAAKALKEKLVLILKGEPPYDLFIRWKSLTEQPIGWKPDINDGVRLNVYPFIEAGVLRKKFNVKWGKDRGKNPSGSHWGTERWNRYEDLDDEWKLKDEQGNLILHLTNELKRKANNNN